MESKSLCHFKPIEGSQIKVRDFVFLKGRPCKILTVDHIKNGKHGGAKFKLLALDLITSKNVSYTGPSNEKLVAFEIVKKTLRLINIDVSTKLMECLDDNNESINLSIKDEVNEVIYEELLQKYSADKSFDVNIMYVPLPQGNDEYSDIVIIESFKEDKE